ncbi:MULTISPECIES: response regulator transcription factor [unclassified Microbacterium]|uniref:response regulator n=1 Tax=unclassified Microbacterium TaxID=2609290 RepID=UPI00214AE3D4|nr:MULTISPECIES: response regulator transcription factor [unclassified Microbacterium]MCR2783516.1 response regulator transcription factor [Microbacterium sp. zg.B96]WIM15622.1 response regulator transcription factor [Microbacterium sp. zg-B96]
MTVRVLIVDDQPMYRAGMSAILGAADGIAVVGEASDGEEALARNRVLHPDVVLMDVRMPKMNGIDATRQLTRPAGPANIPRVVMLTTFDIDEYVYAALEAGASGFLLKDADAQELASAVHIVARGDSLLSPRVTRRLIEDFVASKPTGLQSTTVFNSLTDREREVFLLIATGRSNSEIGKELFMAEQTAKSHVSRILSKLHLRDRIHAVMLAYDTGLVRPGAPG